MCLVVFDSSPLPVCRLGVFVTLQSKILRDLFLEVNPSAIRSDMIERVRGRLQAMHRAKMIDDLRLAGWHDACAKEQTEAPYRCRQWVSVDHIRMDRDDTVCVDLERYH